MVEDIATIQKKHQNTKEELHQELIKAKKDNLIRQSKIDQLSNLLVEKHEQIRSLEIEKQE